jgi:hypothetical protein
VRGLVEKQYSKPCRFCSSKEKPVQIFWNTTKQYFSQGPNSDSPKHDCHNSSTKQKQLDKDKRLNEMFADIKNNIDSKFSAVEQRIDNIDRTILHLSSLSKEIKLKCDDLLQYRSV